MSEKKRYDEENSGLPYSLIECSTGRIGIAQQTCPDEQGSVILFWIQEWMIIESAAKGGSAMMLKIMEKMAKLEEDKAAEERIGND